MKINWHNLERVQTVREERVNSLLHIIGAGLAFLGLITLIIMGIRQHNFLHLLAFILYGGSVLFLYSMSSIYHGIQHPKAKQILARFDYIAIFIMIAGSYSPIALIILQSQPLLSWGLFVGVWAMAIAGSLATLFWVKQIGIVNILVYVAMGLMSLALIPTVYRIMGIWIILSAALGGLLYIVGVYFFGVAKFRYHHAVWHSIVLAASCIHFFTVLFFIR